MQTNAAVHYQLHSRSRCSAINLNAFQCLVPDCRTQILDQQKWVFSIVHQSGSKCTRVHQSGPEWTKVHHNAQECTKVQQSALWRIGGRKCKGGEYCIEELWTTSELLPEYGGGFLLLGHQLITQLNFFAFAFLFVELATRFEGSTFPTEPKCICKRKTFLLPGGSVKWNCL